MKMYNLFFCVLLFLFSSCEKEIDIDVPKQTPSLVVEACINDKFPTLNYVFLGQTLDYFNPSLEIGGVADAQVFITEGELIGKDTIFDPSKRYQFFNLNISDTLKGFYYNYELKPQQGKFYELQIFYKGDAVRGVTQIPNKTLIEGSSIRFEGMVDERRAGLLTIFFQDPPEPSYYRIAYTINRDSNLLGFGASERLRLLSDENENGQFRSFDNFQPIGEGDTINVYLCRMGRSEFNFWRTFIAARNNDGPFATPVQLNSNIRGGIGSFCGYSIDYKSFISR